jgi:hypothetical protein
MPTWEIVDWIFTFILLCSVLRDDPGNSTHKPRSELARSAAGEPHPEPVKGASPF